MKKAKKSKGDKGKKGVKNEICKEKTLPEDIGVLKYGGFFFSGDSNLLFVGGTL